MESTDKQKYIIPKSLEEALKYSNELIEEASIIAGGTDLMVNKQQGNNTSNCLIDIRSLTELNIIKVRDDQISIGASITLENILNNTIIKETFPVLTDAISHIATPVIRKTATIAGNILCENRCYYYNQSDFWKEAAGFCLKCGGDICLATGGKNKCFSVYISDATPALMVLNAGLTYVLPNEEKTLLLKDIYTGDGLEPIALPKNAIIKEIIIPIGTELKSWYKKLRPRKSVDFTNLTVAMSFNIKNKELKIAVAGIDNRPHYYEYQGNEINEKDIIQEISKKCKPVENMYYPRLYRKKMLGVFLKEGLKSVGSGSR